MQKYMQKLALFSIIAVSALPTITTAIIVPENPGICPNESQEVKDLTQAEESNLSQLMHLLSKGIQLTKEEQIELEALQSRQATIENAKKEQGIALFKAYKDAKEAKNLAKIEVDGHRNSTYSDRIGALQALYSAYKDLDDAYEACSQNSTCATRIRY